MALETARNLGFAHLNFKAADANQVETEIDDFKPDLVLVTHPDEVWAKAYNGFSTTIQPTFSIQVAQLKAWLQTSKHFQAVTVFDWSSFSICFRTPNISKP